jgi:rare lipoprotein A
MIYGKIVAVVGMTILLSGCLAPTKVALKEPTTKSTSKRYKIDQDIGPHHSERIPDLSKIPNAVPKPEPKSRIGNPKKYTVFNKTYNVLPSSKGFKQKGVASWYGKKFHGYHTSNGEVYDMYGMSAAHKTLPLPTYVKVTNLDNGKHVIVKVNDRGPFHEDRIIDLSYAAASKLGILASGTANVEISSVESKTDLQQLFVQVGKFSVEQNAKKMAKQIAMITKGQGHNIQVQRKNTKQGKVFHVHIGPLRDEVAVAEVTNKLLKHKISKPLKIKK